MLSTLLYLTIFFTAFSSSVSERYVDVTIDTESIVNTVHKRFVSFTVDSTVYYWKGFIDFGSPRFRTLIKGLSPAFLRVGGTRGDQLIYNETTRQRKGIITNDNFTTLMDVTRSTNTRLIFTLNHQLRKGTKWDSTNAEKLIKFLSRKDYCNRMDWELGNEPEWYKRSNKTVLTPEQIADGYVKLHSVLSRYANCHKSAIIGPAVGRVTSYLIRPIFARVVDTAGFAMTAATVHHYYFRGPDATKDTYMNASYFADLPRQIGEAYRLISESQYPDVPLWFSETATGYASGTANVSDRFVSGFLWLEKLGIAAATGAKVVCRQNLYRGNYALVDNEFNPNPDYWFSWMHKKLVGQKVFAVDLTDLPTPPTTRVYAHCTNTASSSYEPGALTVFAFNVDQNRRSVLTFTGPLANEVYDSYLLEPDEPGDVLSKLVKVNGETLTMPSDVAMPEIIPIEESAGSSFDLPPATMAFIVFPDANIPLCY